MKAVMNLDPDLPAAAAEHYKKIMSGLEPLTSGIVDEAHRQIAGIRYLQEHILTPFIEESARAQGIELDLHSARQTRHKDGSTSLEAAATATHTASEVKLEQSGSASVRIDQNQNITYDLRLYKSMLSIAGSEPFRISRGAQTDLLRVFFTDHNTFKKKKYNIDEICQKLDETYDESPAYYKTKLRKRYLDARCDLNATIKKHSTIDDDFLLYENRHMFIDKQYLKK